MLGSRCLLGVWATWSIAVFCAASAAKIPLGCTVIMFNPSDYTLNNGRSMCIQTVENARTTCGGSRINFVPTLFYVLNPLGTDATLLTRYCETNGAACAEMTSNTIAAFRQGMTACFKRAVQLGFTTLEVTPHLDDAAGKSWRNSVQLSPTQKYGKYSYVDIMLKPLAAAFHAVLSSKVHVYFAMQGEMGATVIRKAADWIPVIKGARALVTQKDKVALGANVKVGISTNWNKLCGCGSDTLGIDPDVYINNFEKRFAEVSKNVGFNLPAIRTLYNTVDFVGISYYPYKAESLTSTGFEYGANLFARELILYGVDLRVLIQKGISFRLHEYGLGGGLCGEATCPAPAKKLLQWPFFGIGGGYKKALDPFLLYQANSAQRAVLRKFYVQSLRWFSKAGGPRYKFDAVYLWNSGSWDVTGTNPTTPTAEGSWKEPLTQQRIKAYNDGGVVP